MSNADNVDIMQDVRRCLDRRLVCDVLNESIRWPEGIRPSAVRVHRFTPRPGGNFDFEYNVTLSGTHTRSIKLFARCPRLPDLTDAEFSDAAELTHHGACNVLVDIPQLSATIHSMDRDPAFAQFNTCADGTDMADRIARLYTKTSGDDQAAITPVTCKPVSFRRGRRFVMRYREPNGTASRRTWAGKCYADDRGEKQCKKHRRIAKHLDTVDGGSVRAARLIGYDPELRMVFTEWDDSEVPADTLAPNTNLARRMAEVLAAVQSIPVEDLRAVRPDRYWKTAVNWSHCLDALCPPLRDQAHALLDLLDNARRFPAPTTPVVVHGDYYESQVLVQCPKTPAAESSPTTLVDLDTLAAGDRCIDLGNALAHQLLWCLDQKQDAPQFASHARALLETYESLTTPVEDDALAYYWAASLFREGAIHAFRDRTAPYVQSLWAMVEPVLSRGRHLVTTDRFVRVGTGPPGGRED